MSTWRLNCTRCSAKAHAGTTRRAAPLGRHQRGPAACRVRPETRTERCPRQPSGRRGAHGNRRVLVALADRRWRSTSRTRRRDAGPVSHGADMRLNDGACDPAGRFWVGSMELAEAPDRGALYRFSGGALERVLDPVSVSNGLGWSPDARLMYYVDSPTRRVDVFEFDRTPALRPATAIRRDRARGRPPGRARRRRRGVHLGRALGRLRDPPLHARRPPRPRGRRPGRACDRVRVRRRRSSLAVHHDRCTRRPCLRHGAGSAGRRRTSFTPAGAEHGALGAEPTSAR